MSSLAISPSSTRCAPRRSAAARPAAPASPTAPVRLTRRGRVFVVLLFLGLLMVTLTVFGSHSAATSDRGTPVHTRTVEVDRGDTLWTIASSVAKPGHVRETIHQIEELNALTGPGLTVGQEIAVPVG
jgi:Tfp pilus assembly protein FimV